MFPRSAILYVLPDLYKMDILTRVLIAVELWDGMEGPQVWHRKESTNRLPLQQVLQTINTSAFEDSE